MTRINVSVGVHRGTVQKRGWFQAAMLAVSCAACVVACNGNNEQISSDYKKLSTTEARTRLQEMLKKRGQSRDLSQPVSASAP